MTTPNYIFKKWAKNNLFTAQMHIALFHILISVLAVIASIFFFEKMKALPFLSFLLPLLSMVFILFYFQKIKKQPKGNILANVSLIALRFSFWLLVGNMTLQYVDYQVFLEKNKEKISWLKSSETQIDVPSHTLISETKFSTQLKNILKKQLGGDTDFSTDWKIILNVLLAILLLFVLGWVTLVISCTVSCNGMEALGLVIFISGLVGVFFTERYFFKKVKRLFNKLKKERPEDFE